MTKTSPSDAGNDPIGTALAKRQPRARRMARTALPSDAPGSSEPPSAKPPTAARGPSKIEQVLTLLRRPDGATLAEMVEATGWLPHTTRAALTGLRKKGHVLAKDRRGEATCYRIAEPSE